MKRRENETKRKETNKATNSAPDCWTTLPLWRVLSKGMTRYRIIDGDIYILRGKKWKRSAKVIIVAVFTSVGNIRFTPRQPLMVLICNALVFTAIMQQNQNKLWDYSHISLERLSPVFIFVLVFCLCSSGAQTWTLINKTLTKFSFFFLFCKDHLLSLRQCE